MVHEIKNIDSKLKRHDAAVANTYSHAGKRKVLNRYSKNNNIFKHSALKTNCGFSLYHITI